MIICPGKYSYDVEFPTSYIRNKTKETHKKSLSHFIVPGVYEKYMIDWATQFIKEDSTFVDIGAHIGSWTLLMSKRAKTIHAFEAQRMVYYQLCGNIAMNELTNVYPHNTALGSPCQKGKQFTIKKYGVDFGSSSILDKVSDELKQRGAKLVDEEEVSMSCLDDYELDSVSLIKIDVEGFELNAIKGSEKTLERCKPKLIIESWNKPLYKEEQMELFKWLKEHKYNIDKIKGYDGYFLCSPSNNIS